MRVAACLCCGFVCLALFASLVAGDVAIASVWLVGLDFGVLCWLLVCGLHLGCLVFDFWLWFVWLLGVGGCCYACWCFVCGLVC